MGKKFGPRPTKEMMLAVNAAIDGDKAAVDRLMMAHELDPAELEQRVATRGGRKFDILGNRPLTERAPPLSKEPAKPRVRDVDIQVTINRRTSVAKLFKLIEQAERIKGEAQQELKRRPPEQIEPVKKALSQIELLRRERQKVEERIREAEEALR